MSQAVQGMKSFQDRREEVIMRSSLNPVFCCNSIISAANCSGLVGLYYHINLLALHNFRSKFWNFATKEGLEMTSLRFDKASFAYEHDKPILDEVDFSVRQGSKITLMGQNGAGKSTIFNLIMGTIESDSGHIHLFLLLILRILYMIRLVLLPDSLF